MRCEGSMVSGYGITSLWVEASITRGSKKIPLREQVVYEKCMGERISLANSSGIAASKHGNGVHIREAEKNKLLILSSKALSPQDFYAQPPSPKPKAHICPILYKKKADAS